MPDPRRIIVAAAGSLALLAACSDSPAPPLAEPPGSQPPPATQTLPTPDELPDGVVAAVDGGLDGGALYIIWDGSKERIDQPAPFDPATVEELGLQVQPAVDRLTAISEPDPRTFWVAYSHDGSQARLHLAIADRLYPVETVPAQARQVDRMPDAQDSLLNRMRPAG